jgi:hypothetical protein
MEHPVPHVHWPTRMLVPSDWKAILLSRPSPHFSYCRVASRVTFLHRTEYRRGCILAARGASSRQSSAAPRSGRRWLSLADAIGYMLRHWSGLVLFLDDGRLEIDSNVVERGMKGIAVARKNALFSGSDGAADHWAIALTLVGTAKLNGVDPLAWLTDVLKRLVSGSTKRHQLEQLLPWNWRPPDAVDTVRVAEAA